MTASMSSSLRECPIKQNMRRFRPEGSGQGVRVAGYPWNGYPQCAQRSPGPAGRKPLWGSVLLHPWLRCSQGPRPSGHWRLACALPEVKNACCDVHSDLLGTLQVQTGSTGAECPRWRIKPREDPWLRQRWRLRPRRCFAF